MKIKCRKCGHYFFEDDSNPSIHYSSPEKLCIHCKIENKKLENKTEIKNASEIFKPDSIENENLLKCPFCGNKAYLREYSGCVTIACVGCGCNMGDYSINKISNVISDWNTRCN